MRTVFLITLPWVCAFGAAAGVTVAAFDQPAVCRPGWTGIGCMHRVASEKEEHDPVPEVRHAEGSESVHAASGPSEPAM